MKKCTYIMTVFCLFLFLGLSVEGAVLSGTDLSLNSSVSSGTIELVLDEAASGLAGYQLEISFNPENVVKVSSVKFPAAFSMNSASTLPASSVSIVAVDLNDQIVAGSKDTLLASLGISGQKEGSTKMEIAVTELTDDSGNPIDATLSGSSITMGTVAPTVTPTPTNTTVPTEEPTVEPTKVPTTDVPTEIPTTVPTTIPTTQPSQSPVPDSEALQAAFTAMPMTGTPPLAVNFTDHSTGSPKKWKWDFGDGTLSTDQNPTHIYGGIGRYSVSLEVMKGNLSSVERKSELIRVVGDYPTGPSGFVMVTSQPSGAEIHMGSLYLGMTPAKLIVPAGSRSLTFDKKGYQNKTVSVKIRPDEIKLIPKVMLKPIL